MLLARPSRAPEGASRAITTVYGVLRTCGALPQAIQCNQRLHHLQSIPSIHGGTSSARRGRGSPQWTHPTYVARALYKPSWPIRALQARGSTSTSTYEHIQVPMVPVVELPSGGPSIITTLRSTTSRITTSYIPHHRIIAPSRHRAIARSIISSNGLATAGRPEHRKLVDCNYIACNVSIQGNLNPPILSSPRLASPTYY